MVRWDLKEAGIKNPKVLEAMKEVPRHLFLNKQDRAQAYEDVDLPINQFLSTPRPYIVAKTIELLDLQGDEKVLEVGTGLGYQSALLGELAKEVYTIEIVPNVGKKAAAILDQLNYKNIHCRIGDGYKGWPEVEPFDAILVMASAKAVPGPLLNQLKNGGRLVIPIDAPKGQKLVLYRKRKNGNLKQEDIMPINLKPMEGRAAGRYW
jgi:protein-L-isoaspartate(D-aspartate) O-methyltransferase